jgi:hypothetical protein
MNPSLLVPTLCSVLLLTAFAFFFASNMAPIFLLITSTILLILSYSMHRSQFQSDYRNSTWQEGLRPVAPFVLVGVVIMLGVGFLYISNPETTVPPPVLSGGRRFGGK